MDTKELDALCDIEDFQRSVPRPSGYNAKDVALFDVDGTLVKWIEPTKYLVPVMPKGTVAVSLSDTEPQELCIDFYGMPKYCREITVHTQFLKSLKARGYFIRVHSGNGAQWAANVVKALKLDAYVDSIETKPLKIVDDKPMEDWAHPIYLGDT